MAEILIENQLFTQVVISMMGAAAWLQGGGAGGAVQETPSKAQKIDVELYIRVKNVKGNTRSVELLSRMMLRVPFHMRFAPPYRSGAPSPHFGDQRKDLIVNGLFLTLRGLPFTFRATV